MIHINSDVTTHHRHRRRRRRDVRAQGWWRGSPSPPMETPREPASTCCKEHGAWEWGRRSTRMTNARTRTDMGGLQPQKRLAVRHSTLIASVRHARCETVIEIQGDSLDRFSARQEATRRDWNPCPGSCNYPSTSSDSQR